MTGLSNRDLDELRVGVSASERGESLARACEAFMGAANTEWRSAAGEVLIRAVFGDDAMGIVKL